MNNARYSQIMKLATVAKATFKIEVKEAMLKNKSMNF